MKLKNILYYLSVIVLLTSQLWAANTNPVVTNVAFGISGTTVTVTYDVADAEQGTVTISMEVSSDGGNTWGFDYTTPGPVTGLGTVSGVSSVAAHKTITWTYGGGNNPNFKIMILANDNTADGSPCVGTEKVYYEGGPNNDGAAYYNTIQIGNQCWLKENLNVGTKITGATTQANNSILEKYCYADQDTSCTKYGGLYQWAEAVAYTNGATNTLSPNPVFSGNVQGICPTGWHIPTLVEQEALVASVSNNYESLKAIGQGSGSGAGTNTSGFSGLLAGYWNGSFVGLTTWTRFVSTTEMYATGDYFVRLYGADNLNSRVDGNNKTDGNSVRCLKD
jgi:uncharacterized protein (TIGR02145 family)